MKYFVTNADRIGSCYYEYYPGKWDEETFWNDASIYLHDDMLYRTKGFETALADTAKDYNPFGDTVITPEVWEEIGSKIPTADTISRELYAEADEWVQKIFHSHGCFTILGI